MSADFYPLPDPYRAIEILISDFACYLWDDSDGRKLRIEVIVDCNQWSTKTDILHGDGTITELRPSVSCSLKRSLMVMMNHERINELRDHVNELKQRREKYMVQVFKGNGDRYKGDIYRLDKDIQLIESRLSAIEPLLSHFNQPTP